MKLDAKTIPQLKLPQGKNDFIFWDEDLSGYGYRLRRTADKVRGSFVAQYRQRGATRRFLIGSAEKLSPSQAREQAKRVLASVELGHDPQQEKEDKRRKQVAHSMEAIVQDYLALKAKELRPRSLVEITRYLTGDYFQPLFADDISHIERRDVAARINKVAGTVAAGRARAALSAFFSWAMQQGLTEANPVIGTASPKQPPARDRVLTDAEFKAIWTACEQCKLVEFGVIVRLLMCTGCRRAEVGGMRWSEFSDDGKMWALPKERSKNKQAHRLPVTGLMAEIIEAVPHAFGRDCLFGARTASGFTQWEFSKAMFDRHLSANADIEPWRLHDVRRSVATGMADIGIAPHVIEQVLNHKSGHKAGIAGIYNRSNYQREVATAMERWSSHIRALVEGGERKVLPMRAAAAA
jgi:integrase